MENNIELFSFININMNNRIPQSCLDPRGESKSEFLTFCEDRHRNQFDEYNNLPWPKPGILHELRSTLPCIDRRGEVDTTDFPEKYDYKYFLYQKYNLNVINYVLNVINYDQIMRDKQKEDLRYTIKKKEGLRYTIKNKDV